MCSWLPERHCADLRALGLDDQGEVGYQFAAAAEFAGRSYPLEIRVGLPQPLLRA